MAEVRCFSVKKEAALVLLGLAVSYSEKVNFQAICCCCCCYCCCYCCCEKNVEANQVLVILGTRYADIVTEIVVHRHTKYEESALAMYVSQSFHFPTEKPSDCVFVVITMELLTPDIVTCKH